MFQTTNQKCSIWVCQRVYQYNPRPVVIRRRVQPHIRGPPSGPFWTAPTPTVGSRLRERLGKFKG